MNSKWEKVRNQISVDRLAVNRLSVIEALKRNRTAHRALFDEAIDGYRKKIIQILEESLTRIRSTATTSGGAPTPIALPDPPMSRVPIYDRYIGFFESSSEPMIMLSVENHAAFVQDNWVWKQQFLESIAPYSTTAAKAASAGSN